MQELRKVLQANGDEVIKEFRDKYKELKVESNRVRLADTNYMGKAELIKTNIL